MENAPLSLEYSADALQDFLDYLAKKGLVNSHTVVSRKAASNKMLSILEPGEAADLRLVDIDQLATRFAHLKGKSYSGQSLQVYKSRLSTALNDFFRYKENPANFKIGGNGAKVVKAKPVGLGLSRSRTLNKPIAAIVPGRQEAPIPTQSMTINFPIPLRPNCVVQVNGLPVDLTKLEAAKIAAVVQAMISVNSE